MDNVIEKIKEHFTVLRDLHGKINVSFLAEDVPHPLWMLDRLMVCHVTLLEMRHQLAVLVSTVDALVQVIPEDQQEKISELIAANLSAKIEILRKQKEQSEKPTIIMPR